MILYTLNWNLVNEYMVKSSRSETSVLLSLASDELRGTKEYLFLYDEVARSESKTILTLFALQNHLNTYRIV